MMADFEVRKDNKGESYWTFQAENNKTMARSSESYTTREGCLHPIKTCKGNISQMLCLGYD
jgi:uncharacterized protein YegP (UPF0339 family)